MVTFDWHRGWHWIDLDLLCQFCHESTHLRDPKGRPAHKVCAEDAYEKRLRREAARQKKGQL